LFRFWLDPEHQAKLVTIGSISAYENEAALYGSPPLDSGFDLPAREWGDERVFLSE